MGHDNALLAVAAIDAYLKIKEVPGINNWSNNTELRFRLISGRSGRTPTTYDTDS
jgi:hypothetical protein